METFLIWYLVTGVLVAIWSSHGAGEREWGSAITWLVFILFVVGWPTLIAVSVMHLVRGGLRK